MKKHHRQSIRLPEYDYASRGAYFITLVTANRENLFGEIVAGDMQLNDLGFLANNEWQRLASRYPSIQLDEWVVMPNHLHGIICLSGDAGTFVVGVNDAGTFDVRARQNDTPMTPNRFLASPLPSDNPSTPRQTISPPPGSLGNILGAYKSTTARLINGLRRTTGSPVWQRNYTNISSAMRRIGSASAAIFRQIRSTG